MWVIFEAAFQGHSPYHLRGMAAGGRSAPEGTVASDWCPRLVCPRLCLQLCRQRCVLPTCRFYLQRMLLTAGWSADLVIFSLEPGGVIEPVLAI